MDCREKQVKSQKTDGCRITDVGCRMAGASLEADLRNPKIRKSEIRNPSYTLPASGWIQGCRYGRRSSRFASSSPATRCVAASHVSVRPSFRALFARMQLAVEM